MEIIRSSRTRGTIIREDIENYEIEFYAPHVLEKQLKNY
jgi:hypothetical protein